MVSTVWSRLRSVRAGRRSSSTRAVSRRCLMLMAVVSMMAGVLAVSAARTPAASAGGSGSDLGSNGQHRRAFYDFGHNPNELSEVTDDLAAGANALEPDIMSFTDAAHTPGGTNINSNAGPSGLFMYHDHVLVTTR